MSDDNLVSRVYGSFRGVDFRGEEINITRSPDSLNVYRDYKETESIKTRPGLECLTEISRFGEIYGIYTYTAKSNGTDLLIIHAGDKLSYVNFDGFNYDKIPTSKMINPDGSITQQIVFDGNYEGVRAKKSSAFVFNNIFYFMDGKNFLSFDGNSWLNVPTGEYNEMYGMEMPSTAYIPTTSIGKNPSGGGTVHEDVNMLSDWRKNSFVGDGESTVYYLDTQGLDSRAEHGTYWVEFDNARMLEYGTPGVFYICFTNADEPNIYRLEVANNGWTEIFINGEITDIKYGVDIENGVVVFDSAPPAPATAGQDNVVICFKKTNENEKKILGCTLQEVFDNRVFYAGNPDYPNMMWHSSLNDPTYCSDLDYYNEGVLDSAKITGLVAGNNALWVFKSPSRDNTTVFYHTPTIDYEYGKIYPSSHSSIATGCVGGAINFNDDIVFFSDKGMEGISGDVTTEQVIAHRSSLVDRKMITEEDYGNMILVEWEGYLVVIISNKAYLADSRAMFTNENHYEYEWFYWEFEENISAATVINGVMYLGTETGNLYALADTEGDVPSYWTTPKDKFKYPQYQKTTNKRGCVVEATGDITVSVKTDKTGWEKIGDYENITDYFVSRIKRKKFKDIQLKFSSETRFTLETATLECFIGGYIKR